MQRYEFYSNPVSAAVRVFPHPRRAIVYTDSQSLTMSHHLAPPKARTKSNYDGVTQLKGKMQRCERKYGAGVISKFTLKSGKGLRLENLRVCVCLSTKNRFS